MLKGLFITGTGTGVGKTYASAFLLSILKNTKAKILYYKPIQCGGPSDAALVKKMAKHKYVANTYNLKTPSSPHFAFAKENVMFSKNKIKSFLSSAKKEYPFIIMEGAGGVRVPIAQNFDMADLAKLSGFPALIVALPGLGTINHTLLSIDYLKSKNVPIKGFVFGWAADIDFNSDMIIDNSKIIETISKVPFCGALSYNKQ